MITEIIVVPDNPDALESAKFSAQHLAQALSGAGVNLRMQTSICFNENDLQNAVSLALTRSSMVIILGGMSRESGEISKRSVAQGLELPIEPNNACFAAIKEYCYHSGEPLLPEDTDLAMLPRSSVAFPNRYGKAPGIAISSANQHLVMLPVGEREAVSILKESVLPYVRAAAETSVTRTLRTYGVGEEAVRRTLAEVLASKNPTVKIHQEGNEVLVKVVGRDIKSQQAAAICTPVLRRIVELLGDAAYGLDVESLQAAVVDKLRKKSLGLAVAESGSGGLLTRVLSETEGCTEVLRYNVFTENAAAKQERLSIPARRLRQHGEVSEETAVLMANAAREKSGAELAVAITMSDGEQDKSKPQGLVYIAVCDKDSVYVKKLVVGSGHPDERSFVLDAALSRALNMVRLFVDYLPERYMGSIPLSEALEGRTVTDLSGYGELVTPKKKPGFLSGGLLIRKTDSPGVKMKKVLFILALLVFLASAGYVGKYFYDAWAVRQLATELQGMYAQGGTDSVAADSYPGGYSEKFSALYSRNPDVVAYISIKNTSLSYPVVQSSDNEYYLRRDFNRVSNDHGVPFMDWRVDVKLPSDNMVIYGHNMKDGQIFGETIKYNTKSKDYGDEKALDFYRRNPLIDLDTIYGNDYRYKIFSVFITNAFESQGFVFDYHNFIESKSDADFLEYVNQLKIRSLIDTGVDVVPGDKLITLSTCTYEFTDARFVVVARRLRPGESENFDTSAATVNPQPLMPDIWYQLYGGSRPPELVGKASVITSPVTNTPPDSHAGPRVVYVTPVYPEEDIPPNPESANSESSILELSSSTYTSPEADSQSGEPPVLSTAEQSQASTPPAQSTAEQSQASTPPTQSNAEQSQAGTPPTQPTAEQSQAGTPSQSNANASRPDTSSEDFDEEETGSGLSGLYDDLLVTVGSHQLSGDALDIISRLVQSEIGSSFHDEAIKAQAVAAYSYISFYNQSDTAPAVVLAKQADRKVKKLVGEVLGEAVYYKGKLALTPYHATSAGYTNDSKDVWGGSYPYLVSVDSMLDKNVNNYKSSVTMTSAQVAAALDSKLGIDSDGEDPEDWISIVSYTDGGYVKEVEVCGRNKSPKTGAKITGRLLRESVLGLRSACFEIDYDYDRDRFTFTTYGYGHGVGLSQNGANQYAMEGWDYIDILTHYYSGTVVK